MQTFSGSQALAFLCLCTAGSLLGTAALTKLLAAPQSMSSNITGCWLAVSCTIGAGAAAYILRHQFGRPGHLGALVALAGIINVTFVSSVVSGSLLIPIFGTMFGPWLMFGHILEGNIAVLPWVLSLYAFHLTRGGELSAYF